MFVCVCVYILSISVALLKVRSADLMRSGRREQDAEICTHTFVSDGCFSFISFVSPVCDMLCSRARSPPEYDYFV